VRSPCVHEHDISSTTTPFPVDTEEFPAIALLSISAKETDSVLYAVVSRFEMLLLITDIWVLKAFSPVKVA
jgi:hypothetical protein